jgi:plasmid stabilization system protein ParE
MDGITDFYLDRTDPATATRSIATIISKCRYLAENQMIGRRLEGYGDEYQSWLALNNRYVIYFRRTGQNSIKVIRVWGANRLPLGFEDLIQADE